LSGATFIHVTITCPPVTAIRSKAEARRPEAALQYKRRHPAARLVWTDLTPNATVQVRSARDTLNVGDFPDHAFGPVNRLQRWHLADSPTLSDESRR
jgi:hypothetical protein